LNDKVEDTLIFDTPEEPLTKPIIKEIIADTDNPYVRSSKLWAKIAWDAMRRKNTDAKEDSKEV
jgi:hypothetical protein